MVLIGPPGEPTSTYLDRLDERPGSARPTPTPSFDERGQRHARRRKAAMLAARLERDRQERQVLAAWAAATPERRIAEMLNLSKTTVHEIIVDASKRMAETSRERLDQTKAAILQRCEMGFATWVPKMVSGDEKATRLVMQLNDQLARITGAYAPVQGRIEHVEVDAITAAIEELERQNAEMAHQLSGPPPGHPERVPVRIVPRNPRLP